VPIALRARVHLPHFLQISTNTVNSTVQEVVFMEVDRKVAALEHLEATANAPNAIPEILRNHTPEELVTLEKKLVRKIDFRALPILIVLFLLNVLDRNAIANARLGGLEASLGIDDVQYVPTHIHPTYIHG
jgi:hypothetical protein